MTRKQPQWPVRVTYLVAGLAIGWTVAQMHRLDASTLEATDMAHTALELNDLKRKRYDDLSFAQSMATLDVRWEGYQKGFEACRKSQSFERGWESGYSAGRVSR